MANILEKNLKRLGISQINKYSLIQLEKFLQKG